uniref:GLOBIN domain-containing protein n=1 Tax=Rhabditophanes sp. KR3021 TaxID=114890 RepID=A0AC35TNB0_9BILA
MFLISKIVRGRRLLHELEAAQAAQKIKDDKEAHENTDEIEDYEERVKPRSNSKGANEINRARSSKKKPETVFEEVFDKLIRIIPSIKEMFATRAFLSVLKRSECSTLRDHAKVTVKMIDLIIKNLDVDDKKRTDTGSSYDPKQIGTSHAQFRNYGITGQYWEKFGEVLIDVVLQQEAIRDLPGANLAWVSLAACIVDQLRVGFDQKCSSLAYSSNVQSTQIKIQDTGSGCTFSQQRQYGQSSVNSNESRSSSIQSLRKNSCQTGAFISAREASSERRDRQKMFIRGQSESTDDYDSHFNQSGRSRCPYSMGHAYSAEERKITLSDLQLQSSDVPSRNIIYNSINPANEMIRPMILSYNNHSSHHNNHNNHNNEYVNDERTLENGGSNRTLTNSRGNLDNIYHSIQNCLTTND